MMHFEEIYIIHGSVVFHYGVALQFPHTYCECELVHESARVGSRSLRLRLHTRQHSSYQHAVPAGLQLVCVQLVHLLFVLLLLGS